MLIAAGLTQRDPVLASLFRVERVCEAAMDQFIQTVDLEPANGACWELLVCIAARGRWITLPQSRIDIREKAMIRQLQLNGTEFTRFPSDSV